MKKSLIGLLLLLFFMSTTAKGEEIYIYGDSIFTTSWGQIGKELGRLSQKNVVDRAVQGSWSHQIKDRYFNLPPASGSIVVFDGGGNDILGTSWACRNNPNEQCFDVAERALDNIHGMLDAVQRDGVAKVIFLGVHYPMNFNSGYNKIIDYVYPKLQDICALYTNCQLVDPREAFAGRPDLLEWDGVHPNPKGANLLASLINQKIGE